MQSTWRCLYSYIHTLEASQIKRFLSLNSFDMTYKLNIKITCLIKYTRELVINGVSKLIKLDTKFI
jgi:hypothetical protein